MRAFVFPGQGVHLARILPEWEAQSPRVQGLVDLAVREAGVARTALAARGGRALDRTEVLQPVLTALVLGIHHELVVRGVEPTCVAGHSLGEVAALSVAGLFTPEDAVALAARRGRAMAREAARFPGGMVACVAPADVVEEAVERACSAGVIAIAAWNAPRQTVVSGEAAALAVLGRMVATTPLRVAGPWHSERMAGAVDALRADAQARVSGTFRLPWIANGSGDVMMGVEEVPALLAEQLVRPIRWVRTMETLAGLGCREIVTIGSKALRGLARDCLGSAASVLQIDRRSTLEAAAAAPAP